MLAAVARFQYILPNQATLRSHSLFIHTSSSEHTCSVAHPRSTYRDPPNRMGTRRFRVSAQAAYKLCISSFRSFHSSMLSPHRGPEAGMNRTCKRERCAPTISPLHPCVWLHTLSPTHTPTPVHCPGSIFRKSCLANYCRRTLPISTFHIPVCRPLTAGTQAPPPHVIPTLPSLHPPIP